ncbi:hypothetical protein TNCV_5142121 [Trichonephila clavipes]|nr:hypothetical protein TNCV_5142121 [Trichonephila clavipes]
MDASGNYWRNKLISRSMTKKAQGNSIHCVGFPSHKWVTNNFKEEECRPVMIKTRSQCQCDKAIYSPPDDEQDTVSELGSDMAVYCLQAPMKWS